MQTINISEDQQQYPDAIALQYAPLGNYVLPVVSLMLQHVWFLKRKNNTPAFKELMHCSWICRLLTLDQGVLEPVKHDEIQGWPDVRDFLIKCLDGCKDEQDVPAMVQQCMLRLMPILENRFIQDYKFPPRAFYTWWYTIHDNNSHLALHLVNAYQPDSPFDHLDHFQSTMLQAVEHAVSSYPGIAVVSCGSWLNGVLRFQDLWPEEFKLDQRILNETGGFGPGAWGQYMTSDGGFNQRNAAVLMRTGKHPFPLTEARSPVDEVLMHLKKRIASPA